MASDDPFAWPIDPAIYVCRVKYAAFLYDALLPEYGHAKALGLAAREAKVTTKAIIQILPTHHRKDKILRDDMILKMRSWGYSIDLIAAQMDLNRSTVTRVMDAFKTRMTAISKVGGFKIHGRLKYSDPRIEGLPVPVYEGIQVHFRQ